METTMQTGADAGQRIRWGSVAAITAAALALYAGFRLLPTGTNLHHMDFQVGGAGALEMCDPSRPQFIPVVEARSPVRVELRAEGAEAPATGRETTFTLTLQTAGGKPVGPADLLTVHTRKLHLLVIDPTLGDYQHLHPESGARAGEWVFRHTPRGAGVYRVFADFTPAATGRGLYSFADYTVAGEAKAVAGPEATRVGGEAEVDAWRFALETTDGKPVRAGLQATLRFRGREAAGGEVPMTTVMDAYAHLVAFDAQRSGFAHLHPRGQRPGEKEAAERPDARRPELFFEVMIPEPGAYVIWAQVNVAGREWFMPFTLDVLR